MDLSQFHFSHPFWLWALLAIPLLWISYFLFFQKKESTNHLEKFIDKHLIPFLLIDKGEKRNSFFKYLLAWTVAWTLLIPALAGPRWDFREIETYTKDQSLVILLDLSESMNATDIKPSRLIKAKQKIEDMIALAQGVKIGLVAFAADPHMISPLTDDKEAIRHYLQNLDTDLIYVQGTRLNSALKMALTMFDTESSQNRALLVISDGSFADVNSLKTAKQLVEKGVVIHTMGVGTAEGSPVKDRESNFVKKNGSLFLSKLEKEHLIEISQIGKGFYFDADVSDAQLSKIFSELDKGTAAEAVAKKKNRIWEEGFFYLLFPALPIFLWWFRKGNLFIFLLLFTVPLQADYFKNSEQLGEQLFNQKNYQEASTAFQDPYRKGVSCYRAGNFAEAEKFFRQPQREQVASSAAYNLGNSLVHQQKLKEAIAAYEKLLEKWPDHKEGKENLELVKKMLEEQQQQNNNQDKQDQDKKENQDSDKKDDKQSENSENDNKADEEQSKQNEEEQQNDDAEQEQQQQTDEKEQEKTDAEKEQNGTEEEKMDEQEADIWLNRITNDPKQLMKNKFYIESKKNKTAEGIDPW